MIQYSLGKFLYVRKVVLSLNEYTKRWIKLCVDVDNNTNKKYPAARDRANISGEDGK